MNRLFAATLAFPLLLWSAVAHAALPTRPEGPVYDGAAIIPDATEAQIDAKLRTFNKDSGKTLIVATVPSLDGAEIEEYAVKLYETWGIGDAEKDEGALILVAPNERRTRIEVGLGSEAVLPDALAGRIIDQLMIPHFKSGDFGGGIAAATDAVSTQLLREPIDAKAVAETAKRAAQQERSRSDNGGGFGSVLFWLFVFFFFILPVIRSMARGGRRYRGRRQDSSDWVAPVIIWDAVQDLNRSSRSSSWGSGGGSFGGFGGGGGGGFGGFGGGISGGGGASGGW